MASLAKALIGLGLMLVALGVLLYLGSALPWLGRLPGDLEIERPGFRLYVPLASCLLISVVLSVLLWLGSKFR